jgi:hypothetical protein
MWFLCSPGLQPQVVVPADGRDHKLWCVKMWRVSVDGGITRCGPCSYDLAISKPVRHCIRTTRDGQGPQVVVPAKMWRISQVVIPVINEDGTAHLMRGAILKWRKEQHSHITWMELDTRDRTQSNPYLFGHRCISIQRHTTVIYGID